MTASSAPGSPLALADAARFSYGGEPILSDVSLAIVAGAALAVTGRSGSGKTTLLLMLAGLLAPTSGSVTWPGLDVDPDRRRARISLVFQAPSLMPELTASENVALPLRLRGASVVAARSATQDALAAVGLSEAGEALPAQLSGGMQQRVAVARALAAKPLLILADEPTGALDREAGAVVMSALRRHAAEAGGALLVATHDLDIAASFSERVELASGRLVMGSPT